ncbi:putative transcriptional regulator, GntR family [Kribbella flavida DSM 17836]|uniref:Putative transcriptional regulator, GntR family n=1 Tax=Kribbella flavida (strain DSM 17836 / JCM 10339 / NBRC 14399) TaxID=479435 RepID=D2PSN8_KRIFD|nr:PLP-dependent aminotransferase family protein [Kribbella flavida]ADB33176.1 putative transcriptional regulator, GntR family [Kribbella flavida DSM 17836]
MSRLALADLSAAVLDPRLGSMTFLNEITARYPGAISFGPGAPHDEAFEAVDPARLMAVFERHLAGRGLEPGQIRRRLLQYGPTRGLLGEMIAASLRTDEAITVDPDQVVVTVGAQEALVAVLRVLHDPARGDVVAVTDPGYAGAHGAARILGLEMVGVPDDGRGPHAAALRTVVTAAERIGRRVRSLVVAPDFANPTGAEMSLAARLELLAEAERLGVLLLEDTTYRFTAPPGAEIASLKALDRTQQVVQIGTFAKIGVPGARLGYVVADQSTDAGTALADHVTTVKGVLTVNTSPIAQAVIGGLLLEHGGSMRRLGDRRAGLYRRNLRVLLEALRRHLGDPHGEDVSWNEPAGGFFVRMSVNKPADEKLLRRSAEDFGVLWTPMRYFSLGDGGNRQLRLACSSLDPEQIDEGVSRLAKVVRD